MSNIYIDVFSGIPYAELFPMIKEIGFTGYFSGECYATDFDKLLVYKQMAEKIGLIQETSHSTIPGCSSLWNNTAAGEEYMDVLKLNIDNCSKLSVPILVVHVQPNFAEAPSFEIGMKRLKTIVKYAQKRNVKIAFENINSAEFLYKTLEYFDDINVGFCYDCGHEACCTSGERYLPQIGNRLLCTHIHDNDSKSDLHLIPFDGQLNFERITQDLKKCHYKGNITLELNYDLYKNTLSKQEFVQKCYSAAARIRELIQM